MLNDRPFKHKIKCDCKSLPSNPGVWSYQSAESLTAALAQGPGSVGTNPTSSCELEDDWSERCGGGTGNLSSSIMTVSSWGIFTVGDSWYLPVQWEKKKEILDSR